MHLKRLVAAAIALPLLYLYISRLSPFFFFMLLTLASVSAQFEFYSMYKTKRHVMWPGIAAGVTLLALPALYMESAAHGGAVAAIYPLVFMFSFMFIASARLFSIKDPTSSLRDIAPAVIGFLYIPNLLLPQWYLRIQGYEWIILLYACVWSSDSLAYYIGTGMGKRKLYKEVSPNKTVEGAAGSVIGGVVSSMLLGKWLFGGAMDAVALMLIGGAIGIITVAGDLVESMFKRDAGVKDSGALLPGHGGILDKIDGVLFAGPVLYLISLMFNLS